MAAQEYECTVCTMNIFNDDPCKTFPCVEQHLLCTECADLWVRQNLSCPFCRAEFTQQQWNNIPSKPFSQVRHHVVETPPQPAQPRLGTQDNPVTWENSKKRSDDKASTRIAKIISLAPTEEIRLRQSARLATDQTNHQVAAVLQYMSRENCLYTKAGKNIHTKELLLIRMDLKEFTLNPARVRVSTKIRKYFVFASPHDQVKHVAEVWSQVSGFKGGAIAAKDFGQSRPYHFHKNKPLPWDQTLQQAGVGNGDTIVDEVDSMTTAV